MGCGCVLWFMVVVVVVVVVDFKAQKNPIKLMIGLRFKSVLYVLIFQRKYIIASLCHKYILLHSLYVRSMN
jgi:hypothetical protein